MWLEVVNGRTSGSRAMNNSTDFSVWLMRAVDGGVDHGAAHRQIRSATPVSVRATRSVSARLTHSSIA